MCVKLLYFYIRRYNKLSREIRELANKIKDLDATNEFRTEASAQLLEKLYQMGLIPTRWDLALAANVSASAFCRRRLPVVMVRSKNTCYQPTSCILNLFCGNWQKCFTLITFLYFLDYKCMLLDGVLCIFISLMQWYKS